VDVNEVSVSYDWCPELVEGRRTLSMDQRSEIHPGGTRLWSQEQMMGDCDGRATSQWPVPKTPRE
jgi:hypothetical protein